MKDRTCLYLKKTRSRVLVPKPQPRPMAPASASHPSLPASIKHDIRRLSIFPKLEVNAPDDQYEQEADQVANQVVARMAVDSRSPVQRAAPEEELQRKPLAQRASVAEGGFSVEPDMEQRIERARGSGSSLSQDVRGSMEGAFGTDFSGVRVHTDGPSDALNRSLQARAFTTGSDIFFRSGEYAPGSKQGQELLAHELTHVVQQTGGQASRQAQRRASGVLQRYVDQNDVRASDTGSMALVSDHDLYARQDLITDANQRLSAVASGLGAFITLNTGAAYNLNPSLLKVTPQWNANRGQQSANHKELGRNQQPNLFKTQNDCYMTASLASGIDDRETGTGETTYGKYKVKDRNDQSGQMTTEASAPLDTKEMEKRGVSKPTLAGGGMPYQAAIRNMYRFYMLNMPVFRDWLAGEYREGSTQYTAIEVTNVQNTIIAPIGEAERKAGPAMLNDPTALQEALQSYLRIYSAITDIPALYTRFSAMFGVNEALNPEVGDALAIMNDPKERDQVAEQIKQGAVLDELWNYHFAGVVMKDTACSDFITLENAAESTHEKFNAQWGFYMYGSRADRPEQTFHGALKEGEHGPGIGHSPLTMAFASGKAPNPVVDWPKNNSVITSDTYTVNVKPEGAINNVRVQIDSGDWQQARFESERWYYDWKNYEEGQHTIKVEAWNVNGQRVEKTVRVNYRPPEND